MRRRTYDFLGAAASRRTVRSICIHRSYGIKYTWHVHESDNCHSCSTDVSINRVRSFALPICSFVRWLTRSYLLQHSLSLLFSISASFSLPYALFIVIIPRYALTSHPRSFGDSIRDSCFSFCTSRRLPKRGWCPPAKRTSSQTVTLRRGKFRCRPMFEFLFSSVLFLTSLHFVSSDKSGKSRPAFVDKRRRATKKRSFLWTFSSLAVLRAPLCKQSRRN